MRPTRSTSAWAHRVGRGRDRVAAWPSPTVALVSFRFGTTDGVSVEAGKWARILERLGFRTFTVAAEGADRLVPGLGIADDEPPEAAALGSALADADLVVVENLCSLPLNPAAGRAVADCLRGRPALLHHHDLAWQRPHLAHIDGFPPDDPAWRHVTINDLSRRQLAERGVAAVTIPNGFDTETPPGGDRDRTRDLLGLAPTTASSSIPPGPSPARTWPAPSPWPRASTPPTGCSARPRTATAPSSTASSPPPPRL